MTDTSTNWTWSSGTLGYAAPAVAWSYLSGGTSEKPVWNDWTTDNAFSNGPVGRTNYNDRTKGGGFNVTGSNALVDATTHGFWYSYEDLFYQSVHFASEWHPCSLLPSGSGATATLAVTGGVITGATVTAAGLNYKVGQRFVVSGGTYGVLEVATVSGTGIATLTVYDGGSGYSNGASVNLTPGEIRPLTFFLPVNGGAGSIANTAVDMLNSTTYAGRVRIQWDYAGNQAFFQDGFTLKFAKNNTPAIQQINAAGNAYLNLLKANNQDRAQYDVPLYIAQNNTAQPSLEVAPGGTLPSGTAAIQVNGGTSAAGGSLLALNAVMSADTGVTTNIQNNKNATNAKVGVTLQALYGNSGCDVYTYYNNIGVNGTACDFISGIDQSALSWKLSQGSVLGTNDIIIADKTKLNIEHVKPPKLPSYTAATLPSAATYDGCLARVSDANATTARSTVAGGGSNKVIVMSDGTNWLIVA